MTPDHTLTVSLDLLRRLTEHTRTACKLLDDRGETQAAVDAQRAAMEADEVALGQIDEGRIYG